jgi:hypothetical protein
MLEGSGLTDPDPGGPKTNGSYGSISGTLHKIMQESVIISNNPRVIKNKSDIL